MPYRIGTTTKSSDKKGRIALLKFCAAATKCPQRQVQVGLPIDSRIIQWQLISSD